MIVVGKAEYTFVENHQALDAAVIANEVVNHD